MKFMIRKIYQTNCFLLHIIIISAYNNELQEMALEFKVYNLISDVASHPKKCNDGNTFFALVAAQCLVPTLCLIYTVTSEQDLSERNASKKVHSSSLLKPCFSIHHPQSGERSSAVHTHSG